MALESVRLCFLVCVGVEDSRRKSRVCFVLSLPAARFFRETHDKKVACMLRHDKEWIVHPTAATRLVMALLLFSISLRPPAGADDADQLPGLSYQIHILTTVLHSLWYSLDTVRARNHTRRRSESFSLMSANPSTTLSRSSRRTSRRTGCRR